MPSLCFSFFLTSLSHPVISVIAVPFRPRQHYTEEIGNMKKEITGHFGKSRSGREITR